MIDFQTLLKTDYEKWKNKDYLFEKEDGKYTGIKFGHFIEYTAYLANYLIDIGLKDKKIIVFGKNSVKWMISDLAIMSYVGISVGVSKEYNLDDLINVIDFLEVDAIIYSNEKEDIIKKLRKERDIVYISMEKDFDNIIDIGKRISKTKSSLFDFENIDRNKCIKVVFTSGTTSMPKAVMLSEKNIFAGWNSLKKRAPMDSLDICYLFLPLHHTYGGIYNFIYSLISGMKIYLSTGVNNIQEELQEVRPTVFCSVPLIYKNFYKSAKDTKDLPKFFGNNIKYLFCGGAYIEDEIRADYKNAGLDFLVAYALSETASSFAIEYSKSTNNNSVGKIFEDIKVKISEKDENGIGEIRVKGNNVFLGYMNNEMATKSAFDEEGYFKTGDLGYIDKENNLYITGRIKNILLTSKGENIYPEEIKEKILNQNIMMTDVKLYIKQDCINADIYVKQIEDINYDEIIKRVNTQLKRHEKIEKFKIVVDSIDKRLKQ